MSEHQNNPTSLQKAAEAVRKRKVEEKKRITPGWSSEPKAGLMQSKSPNLQEQTLKWSTGSSQEPGGGIGRGRGGQCSTMPQCSPSVRPRNKAQWMHCQQAFSCTFIGLPDTRPLPFFNNQHNNLFRGRSNGLLLDHWAERDHSALNDRCLRWFLCFFLFFSFHCCHWHAIREWEIITMLLLAKPWGFFLALMACG